MLSMLMACGTSDTPSTPAAGPAVSVTLPDATVLDDTVRSSAPDTAGAVTVSLRGNDLLLSDGRQLATGLFGTRIMDVLSRPGHAPLLLLQARPCAKCTLPESLYVLDPELPVPTYVDGANAWHASGRLIDDRTGEHYYEAQVYSGTVLPGVKGVVWYETALMPDGQWKKNTTLLRTDATGIDTLVSFGHGQLAVTQGLAFKGKCLSVPGLQQRVPA
jgi:hypothetical protein